MTRNIQQPPSLPCRPRDVRDVRDVRPSVLSRAQLRACGVSPARAAARCGADGPWQRTLPGVYVLHRRPLTADERLRAALLYAGRPPAPGRRGAPGGDPGAGYGGAVVTGFAALALRGFAVVPPPGEWSGIDVLVPHARRSRPVGYVRPVRSAAVPPPGWVRGLPVAPVERALADAVAGLRAPSAVRRLLVGAVRGGHCEPGAAVDELGRIGLLDRPPVARAADALLAEDRAMAESRLYDLVMEHDLPQPLWNVCLRLPGGPRLGAVDAYWPGRAVAVALVAGGPGRGGPGDGGRHRTEREARWAAHAAEREHLERLGITVVRLAPEGLRDAGGRQAAAVRTALRAAADREPAARVVVLPR
ncbi:hypothetical protein ACFYW1_20595 [Streptomyces sp. NPDC002669]|uniref:hypothetical protein n=1 Tax=Streptomyces sp. NPDC002669 TaxID=3364658 RepID=UPI0036BC3F10